MVSASPHKYRYDFVVYDRQGRAVAVVEAKRRFKSDTSWARAWHASTAPRSGPLADASVVLVSPDRVYVWRPGTDETAGPDWTFEAGPWFAPYFARLRISPHDVDPRVFEQIVGLWLQDVVLGALPDAGHVGSVRAVLGALLGGEVVQPAAA
ncbi:MAG TPA: hypothetical protein VFT22_12715 [Kofleriaceae bacterium]|nr:hypothetical protein [Kofleriaceae bacterium]